MTALRAIEEAQEAFDGRLKEGFSAALTEMEKLGYPGVTDPKIHISTRLRPVDGLSHEAAVQYVVPITTETTTLELMLPEQSNGLGYQNLISMVFRLMSFRDAWMRVGKAEFSEVQPDAFIAPLHLVLIEEPEAYLHTQVQQVFIRQAYTILRKHPELGEKPALTTQLVVSTHSSHIANECEFASLRYFRRMPGELRRMPGDKHDIPISFVVNLTNVFGDDTVTKRFATRYLKVAHCDLFFADAAVLIEGPAERILVPYFVRSNPEFRELSESYITWLEIGGSHAHRLRDLIESLGLTTLIITDLDAVEVAGSSARPQRNTNQKSRNETLKSWCPCTDNLDKLLTKTESEMAKSYVNERFAVRVAYQRPVQVRFKDVQSEALANTLEDSLVLQNLGLFSEWVGGKGLSAKFKKAIEASDSVAELGDALFKALKDGGKAELALDLLEIQDDTKLVPPEYIRDGLKWLKGQLRERQSQLGLSIGISDTSAAA